MYVNEWTLDYGERGRQAVRELLDRGVREGVIARPVEVEFADA
jgi:1,4-dihydroxy-6-naphthoate synthase